MHSSINQVSNNEADKPHTPKIIAENIFNNLKLSGLSYKDILTISSEILDKLTRDIQERNNQKN